MVINEWWLRGRTERGKTAETGAMMTLLAGDIPLPPCQPARATTGLWVPARITVVGLMDCAVSVSSFTGGL